MPDIGSADDFPLWVLVVVLVLVAASWLPPIRRESAPGWVVGAFTVGCITTFIAADRGITILFVLGVAAAFIATGYVVCRPFLRRITPVEGRHSR